MINIETFQIGSKFVRNVKINKFYVLLEILLLPIAS